MQKYILSLDQGTTSSRAVIYNKESTSLILKNEEFDQLFPQNAWVEHDPEEIWRTQYLVAKEAIGSLENGVDSIEVIGITNQRETTVVWNRKTGKAIYNAIVWQDRRTASYCEELKRKEKQKTIYEKTGLIIDSYFSASKIAWILDNVNGARELAEKGDLAFGTVDSWLCWKLTKGKVHICDVSNASRTMLFNIHTLQWDDELLKLFNIPLSMLPKTVDSSGELAFTDKSIFGKEILIGGLIGDQQSALFGQSCFEKGQVKCTYGTGCFLMLNTGDQVIKSSHNLLSTLAWKIGDSVSYAIEGSVFIGGAVIQWLRDELLFFKEAADSEALAEAAEDNGGVYFVPALSGLGAPHWDPYARGAIFGITRNTNKAHLTRAALESICFQVNDLLEALKKDYSTISTQLRVDGGASANNLLLQFQADISYQTVLRAEHIETTALGAAYLAGLAKELWTLEDLKLDEHKENVFMPSMNLTLRNSLLHKWNKAIDRSGNWESNEE